MRILFVLLIALVTLNLQAASAEDKQTVRLGATIPLTGDFATYGTQIKNGIELAIAELEADGTKVEITYEDVPYPGPKAVTAIRKLAEQDKIQGLAGNFLNPAIPAMAPTIRQKKVLAFHTAIADDLILDAGDFVVTTNAKIKDEAAHLADYAFNKLGARTASILYITTTFGDNYATHFARHFEKLGGKILYKETTAIGDTDLRAVLTQVKAKKADVFFAAYFGTNMGVVLKQAATIDIKSPILGVYETEDASVLEIAGSAAEGVMFFVPEAKKDYPELKEFTRSYKTKYNSEPLILAKNAYDATKILVSSLADCEGETECARDKVYKLRDYPGASGRITIDADGGAQKSFVLKTVKDGKFERVKL